MPKPKTGRALLIASTAAMPLLAEPAHADPGDSRSVTALKALGKSLFFDTKLSIPANKQACASCHDAAVGGVLPNSAINATTVVAPGAAPHALGNLKPPTNAYATDIAPFQTAFGVGLKTANNLVILPGWGGGNFWDGRAEGCGASAPVTDCPVIKNPGAAVSETTKFGDLPDTRKTAPNDFTKFLGPTADQALNPFPNNVEQNTREKNVCQNAKTASYKGLYFQAYGVDIDCSPNPQNNPTYRISFKRLAVAIAAWQSSDELNSFSSPRDKALADDKKNDDGHFPLRTFSNKQNLGHDLFYGITSDLNPTGKNAGCAACHNGLPGRIDVIPGSRGEEDHQLYTDGRFHHLGVPFNREIPGVAKGEKVGVAAHAPTTTVVDVSVFPPPNPPVTFTAPTPPGFFKTSTLRNVAKGAGDPDALTPSKGFTKAYTHNGYFKSLKQIVHFYNTRDALPVCTGFPNSDQATAAEAIAHNCWPRPEFDSASVFGAGNTPGDGLGNLGLTDAEENDIVAYLETLSDDTTPQPPTATKSQK